MSKRVSLHKLWGKDTWVRPFLSQYKKALATSLALGVLTMMFAAALMFTSGYLISVSSEHPEMGVYAISAVLGFVQIFGIGKPFLGYFERLTSHNWVLRLTSTLRARLYASFERENMLHAALRKTGEALGLLSEDIGHIQNLYLRVIFPQIVAAILAVLLTLLLGAFSPLLGLSVLLLMLVLTVLVPLVSALVNGKRRMKAKECRNLRYNATADNIAGLADWNFSGRRDEFIAAITSTYDQAKIHDAAADSFDRKRDFVLQAFFCMLIVLVFTWAGSYFGGMAQSGAELGDMSRPVNWIAAFVLGLFPLAEAFVPLPYGATEMACHLDAVERLNDLTETESEPELPRPSHGKGPAPQGTGIRLDGVTFAYPGDDCSVIDNMDLVIPAGQKLAILGPSGTGKSTLAWLLRGDLAPTAGSVTIGGVPASQLENPHELFGFIQQTPYLFNKTLLDNLRLANPHATEEEAAAALSAVGLGPLLDRLPHGLATMVDEAGLRFSGGERHRIALARILLADTPVVILDEPTVSLDPDTEHQLLETVFAVLEGRTIIMITHHLTGVSHMDRVVFLEQGSIQLEGTPNELAATNPRYQRLLQLNS